MKCAAWLDSLFQVSGIAGEPRAELTGPSFGIGGRFIFTPSLFQHLEVLCAFPPGEVRLTDALTRLLRHETVLAFHLPGTRYDCSTKLGYLKAMLAFGLAHPELRDDLASHLGDLYKTMEAPLSAPGKE